METKDISTLIAEKIQYGGALIHQLEHLRNIEGVMKLQRKIRQEIEFFKKLERSKKAKAEQLCCSNLRHLGALAESSMRPGVVAVCKIFHIDEETKLHVDIISDEGKMWSKVIARNPRSLSSLSAGQSSYGARSILDQAQDYMKCAKLYPCMYQPPKVLFEFVSGIEETLANQLRTRDANDTSIFKNIDVLFLNIDVLSSMMKLLISMKHRSYERCFMNDVFSAPYMYWTIGVCLQGEILPDSRQYDGFDESTDSESNYEADIAVDTTNYNQTYQEPVSPTNDEEKTEINTLNLDVTTMMAVISNMTNGHCNYVFKQDVLTQQCAWESEKPVRPILEDLFKGKKLICCNTAWNDFEKIVNTLGGPMEKMRAVELKTKLSIFPDEFAGEDDYPRSNLKVRGNVRQRSKTIFNFGHRMKALTVSANDGFVRSAHQQGVDYATFIHESRALTEGKEVTATMISVKS